MLEGTGLKPKHYKEPVVQVWPEAWPVIEMFRDRLHTQWRGAGMGLIGLDYGIAYAELDRKGLDAEAREEFLDNLRVVEQVALKQMAG